MSIFNLNNRMRAGKVNETFFAAWNKITNLWGKDASVDYSRNDTDLFRSLYFASVYNGKGKDYLLGASLAKPIINAATAFTVGKGFTVDINLRGTNGKKTQKIKDAEEVINDWLQQNHSKIYDWVRHSGRDGDGYLYVDEFGEIDEFDANNVEVVLDKTSGQVIGFDVTETVYETDPDNPRPKQYNIVKNFRQDSVKYTQYDEHGKNPQVLYYVVFTEDGVVMPQVGQEYSSSNLEKRPLPVIHYANEAEPRAIYGNSEFQNLLALFKNYHAVMASGIKNVIYNGHPIPIIKGAIDPSAMAADSNAGQDGTAAQKKSISWDEDMVINVDGEKGDAKFLQATGVADDVTKMAEYLFYLIVEASETPEFVFGPAVTSSKASTETQMPVMVMKAERKRTQLRLPIQQLVNAYIDRQIRLSNPTFLQFKGKQVDIMPQFPPLVDEDKQLTLDTVEFLQQAGLLSDKTTLELLLSTKINDIDQELEDAKADGESAANRNNVIPTDANRLQNELNALPNDQNQPQPGSPQPANPAPQPSNQPTG